MRRKGFMAKSAALCMAMVFTTGCGNSAPDIVFSYSQSLFYNYASSGALNDLTALYEQYGSNIATYCEEATGNRYCRRYKICSYETKRYRDAASCGLYPSGLAG